MEQAERERITNRHIAKLLSRLTPLNLPEIAISEIKRQMWFLSDDLQNIGENKENVDGKKIY